MMKSLNRAQLKGTIGRDPQINTTDGGRRVTNLSVATDFPWQDKDGKWQHDTDWHNVVVWEGYGIPNLESLRKGTQIYISGRLRTRKYTDRSGMDRYITEIIAEEIDIIEREPAQGDDRSGRQQTSGRARQNSRSEDEF